MDILIYNELEVSRVKKQYDKVVEMIRRDDFYSAEVKKLAGTPYYRAKLDYTHRLLFKVVNHNQKKYALLLEVIYNHAYEKSRFLNGAKIDDNEAKPVASSDLDQEALDTVSYINPENACFHFLDKIISFDTAQDNIFKLTPPLVIIGSAGSGKSMLTLEKMKTCPGQVLYVTESPYLVQNARQLYYTNHYANDNQEISFLSYAELLESIRIPEGKVIDFQRFSQWLLKTNRVRQFQDTNKLYEEFKGVITGHTVDQRYLSREQYIGLGIKQSVYTVDERQQVYELFEKYLMFLKENNRYDINIISYDYLTHCQALYDYIVIDEVQDFTPIQISLVLKMLKSPQQFILCGDANQIVHPNFFSWAKIKSLFYHHTAAYPAEIIRVLSKNYRNAPDITAIANNVLKIKTLRFGSIDKESHYLVESQSTTKGEVYCLLENEAIRQEINNKTRRSTRFAVIVLREELKEKVSRYFQTPLVFSIYEAKGLEYDNVILYNFISSEEKRFREIAQGVDRGALQGEFTYRRAKDKADRSLEIYKFFINALYVAITRAVKNVYIIENIAQHPFMQLLGLTPAAEFTAIEVQESSLEDWQKEARRLEMQGKQTQANAIRDILLDIRPVPWTIMTPDYLIQLREKALNQEKKDKAARLLLFEYAMSYHYPPLFVELAQAGFAPALKAKKDYELIERKYYMGYSSHNITPVLRQVSLYGIDFRNIFNQTPLMVACDFGNNILAEKLMQEGANADLTDNFGRKAFQIVLQKSFIDKRFAQEKLVNFCEYVLSDHLPLQLEGKLTKLDAQRMEFFLVNAMLALALQRQERPHQSLAFKVDDFLVPLACFPERLVSERRKRRAYVSSVLAKNEINRKDIYNKKLFLRIRHGYYLLNPDLQIKIEEKWVRIGMLHKLEHK